MKKKQQPTNLGSLLGTVFQQKNWQQRLELHQVFLFWDKVIGKEIASHAQPEVMRGKVLWVGVSDSIWMQHLQFEKMTLLENINKRLAQVHKKSSSAADSSPAVLEDIRFSLRRNPIKLPEPTVPKAKKTVVIDQDKLARFEADLNTIDDQKIRASLKRLWLTIARRDK